MGTHLRKRQHTRIGARLRARDVTAVASSLRIVLPVTREEGSEQEDGKEVVAARQGIQSVELAMTVLHAIEEGLGPMSLTEIATAAGMAPSKAHRYLVSLGRVGLVVQSRRSGLYDLGPAMRRLGIESLRRMDEVGLASEHLPGLRDRTSHAVNLAVWGEHGPVIVRWDYGAYALPITVRVGATMPLLSSSVGQVYLAYLPQTITGPVLESQLAVEDGSMPSAAAMWRVRKQVLKRGVAITSGGVIPGVTSVAAPVFPAGESLPLVVALALPARQADDATLAAVTAELLRTTAAIAVDLGSADGPANTNARIQERRH
jgi:DNA-binding IclR family transcriptional regulator